MRRPRGLAPLAIAAGAAAACLVAALLPSSVAASPTAKASSSATATRSHATAAGAVAMPSAADAEGEFLDDINQLRTSQGLNALIVDPELTDQARIWASTMNDAGRIYHSSNLAGGISANWMKLGENVGVGGDVGTLFQAFVDSPSHYENLVDPAYTHVGVGVVISADGSRMFTAHRFMALMPAAPPAPPPTQPPPVARDTPPSTLAPTTVPPTVPPTTVPPTTVVEPPRSKLGPIESVAALIAAG